MRMVHKMWRNGKGGRWHSRIKWYQGVEPNDIRLELEDSETKRHLFPSTKDVATQIWEMFKHGCEHESSEPMVRDLIAILKTGRVKCGGLCY